MGKFASVLRPSAQATNLFGALAHAVSDAGCAFIEAVHDNPTLSKVAAIAFPPARGILMASQLAGSFRQTLNTSSLSSATNAWSQTEGQNMPLADRMQAMAKVTSAPTLQKREQM